MERDEPTGIGTAAAVLGTLGLMALVMTPVLLPASLAAPPLGIAAVVCGAVARGRARRNLATGPATGTATTTANLGIGLGITAFVVPVLFLTWAAWALHEAYDTDGDNANGSNSSHGPVGYVAPERTLVSWSAAPKPDRQHPGRIVYRDGVEVTVHTPQAFVPGPDSPAPLPKGKQAYRVLISISSPARTDEGPGIRPDPGPFAYSYSQN
ncbi:hypothetical protein DEJ50_16960 [Streptomyces venezuelae]|uniref:DUF4190 domain-containing protein n=1 Tax=Streptomyces venezuelae TaxID=54571 RepID=A0A5P2D265_STRVZ|nr:hypothetical protein [Streptomyces venezuelae]QES49242.1 hypothetical protein DEJ50_16960 [Streptomyces venezuelae]